MEIGDRIRIKSYNDKDGNSIEVMIGQTGTVDLCRPDNPFIDCVMDNELGGTRLWMLMDYELEVI